MQPHRKKRNFIALTVTYYMTFAGNPVSYRKHRGCPTRKGPSFKNLNKGSQMKRRLGLLLFLCTTPSYFAQTHIQLILDASGSMWNKFEDGRYRISAAKDVLQQVVNSLPQDTDGLHVGLRIYGAEMSHKEAGACRDTRLFVPMQGVDRAALLRAIRKARAQGATPIALSLQAAAADFAGVTGKKSIILVTDGLESCDGDMQAAVAQLKKAGVDIDLRIIGLDLPPQAVEIFSRYAVIENVADAAALSKVLVGAVEQQISLDRKRLKVTVTLTRAGKAVTDAKVALANPLTDQSITFDRHEDGYHLQAEPGSYNVLVEDLHAGKRVFSGIAVNADQENRYSFELAPERNAKLTVAVKEAVAGSPVTIQYEGAPTVGEPWITIVAPEQGDGEFRDWAHAPNQKGEVTVAMPETVGQMEARLVAAQPSGGEVVLARAAVTALKAEAGLTVPQTLPGNYPFEAFWTGPNNKDDYITIVPVGSEPGYFESWQYTHHGSPARLLTKPDAGAYEVRYMTGNKAILASAKTTVTAATAALQASDSAMSGGAINVSWQGPNGPDDFITVVPPESEDGAYLGYAYTRNGNDLKLELPLKTGTFELRYVTGTGGRVLARRPLTLTPVKVALTCADTVKAGGTLEITWQGPNGSSDYVTIVKAGAPPKAFGDYRYTRDGQTFTLRVPDEPGSYEVRYNNENEAVVLGTKALEVQ